jgi:hypothetical protein
MYQEILYINNSKVDLDKQSSISLTREFLDLQNPESRVGDFSLNVKLPKTKNNKKIFEHVQVENKQDKFVKTIDYTCAYYVDGRLIFSGIFRILSVEDNYFEGVLLGDNIAWSKLLSGKTLKDLKNDDGITPWSVPFFGWSGSSTQYSANWYINNIDYNTQDITFPLISYGSFFTSNSTPFTNGIYLDSIAGDDVPPSVYDLKIIKRIFQNIGFNVNSSIFSLSEAQKVYLPFTASDRYTWNYGQILKAYASGSTFNIPRVFSANTQADYARTINFVSSGTNKKNCDFSVIDFPNIINNPAGNIVTQTFLGQNGIFSTQQYNTPVTDVYSFDVEINNWKFENKGLYRNDFVTQFASAINYGLASSAYTPTYFLREGFFVYLDDEIGSYTNQIQDNITRYCWQFYESYFDELFIDNNLVLAAYVPSHTGTTTFFQPYDESANIIVTGNSQYTLYSGWTGPITYYDIHLTGSTRFEFRDVKIPSGFSIKVGIFGPAYSSGSTASIGGANISDEISYGFSAQSVSINFFSSKNDDVDLNLTNNLPNIGQLDYVKSFINRYFLQIDADYKDKVISLEPYSSYFLPNDYAIDITSISDNNFFEPDTEPVKLPKNIFFKWNNDNTDALLKQDIDYGNLQITSDNVYNEGDKEVKLIFSSTKFRDFDVYSPGFTVTASTISLPSIANEESYSNSDLSGITWSFAYTPRLLKLTGEYATDSSGNTIFTQVGGYNSKILLSEFKNETPGKLSLAYDGENGLYENYFERFYSEIGDSYIINLDLKMTPEYFQKMVCKTPVILNGQSYFINSIKNYNIFNNKSQKVSIIKKFTN